VPAEDGKKLLIGPGEGAYLPTLRITHKVTAEAFGGAFTSIEARLPPGEMIHPHTHSREDECNFVLEGELTFDIGGRVVVATVGSFVIKPRGIYHACSTRPGGSRTTTTSTSESSGARWRRRSG
jgi:quercetin dioxygenase-like cupin family protein